MEVVQENQEKMIGQMQTMRQRMKAMAQHNERLEAMMKQLLRAQNVEIEEEDDQEEDLNLVAGN